MTIKLQNANSYYFETEKLCVSFCSCFFFRYFSMVKNPSRHQTKSPKPWGVQNLTDFQIPERPAEPPWQVEMLVERGAEKVVSWIWWLSKGVIFKRIRPSLSYPISPSKVASFWGPKNTPCEIQVQTPPLEGPRILRDGKFNHHFPIFLFFLNNLCKHFLQAVSPRYPSIFCRNHLRHGRQELGWMLREPSKGCLTWFR